MYYRFKLSWVKVMKCPRCGEELKDILEFKDEFDKRIGNKNILASHITKNTFFVCVGCWKLWKFTEASKQELLEKMGIIVRRTRLEKEIKEIRDQSSSEEEIEFARKKLDIPPTVYRAFDAQERKAVHDEYIKWLLEKHKDEV